ncbi:MAG: hypothetical protein SGJ01_18815 [Gemmatimonadota bacterium]|nr:hypothetical protein [Gemmatimonadota bacterium]
MRPSILAAGLALMLPASVAAQDRPAPEVSFSATVLLNGFYTSAKSNNVDLPQFAIMESAADSFPTAGLGGTMRQTRAQARAFAGGVLGGDFTAEIDVDFWGGQQPSNGGRTFPLLRIRRAWAEMNWGRFRLLMGQEAPPIVELNPSSLGSLGLSSLSNSGNLWLWIPQVRATGVIANGKAARLELEGAVLAPTGYVAQGPFVTQPDIAEQSQRPYLQSRLRIRWGSGDNPGEFGVGGHMGWLATAGDSLLDSKAAAVSMKLPLGSKVELRGEAFTGEGIAGLGGGGIGQNLGLNGRTVRTIGGWGQLLIKPSAAVELGASFGIDDPKDADLDTTVQRLKNRTIGGHIHWRPAPLVLGLEYRQIETTYGAGKVKLGHVNLAVGAEF